MKKILLILSIIVISGVGIVYYLSPEFRSIGQASLQITKNNDNQQNQVMLKIDAKKWQFYPNIITVKKGQKVKIIINNTDATHGINLPEFNVSGNDSIEFTAYKTGTFPFLCNNFCGDGHAAMLGKVIVTEY